MQTIAEFAPEGLEAGVGLALRYDLQHFAFVLAGKRHRCPSGELFYAGVGGHREPGENWAACAQREAREELGASVEIMSALVTWRVRADGVVRQVDVRDRPRPYVLFEMVHPPGTDRAGELYRIVVYEARLPSLDTQLTIAPDDVQGVVALTGDQVLRSLERKARLSELLDEGALMLAGGDGLDPQVRLYPLGTAAALSHVLRHALARPQTRYQGAIVRDGAVLLIQHREHASGRTYWLLPGGAIEPGETPETCVAREMLEETDLTVGVERLLLDVPLPGGRYYQRHLTYLCTPLAGEAAPGYEPEPDAAADYGIVDVRWVPLADEAQWGDEIRADGFTLRYLHLVRQALDY